MAGARLVSADTKLLPGLRGDYNKAENLRSRLKIAWRARRAGTTQQQGEGRRELRTGRNKETLACAGKRVMPRM